MEIIFVCTGNTCRSPLAEGLMKKLLQERGIDNIDVSSAGLAAYTGDEVSEESVRAAKNYGVDISAHRSRRINSYMLENAVFVCMTAAHEQALKPYVEKNRLFVIGEGIPDPYGGTQEEYDSCAEKINCSLPDVLSRIISANSEVIPMRAEHIKEIAEIESLCFSQPWSEKALEEELTNENAHFLAALFNQKVIGYIGVIEICGEADITNVAVNPAYRRCGIGEKLLCLAEEGANTRNCISITLEVRMSNEAAISLYNKNGYKHAGIRKGFYNRPKEDALLMTKTFGEE